MTLLPKHLAVDQRLTQRSKLGLSLTPAIAGAELEHTAAMGLVHTKMVLTEHLKIGRFEAGVFQDVFGIALFRVRPGVRLCPLASAFHLCIDAVPSDDGKGGISFGIGSVQGSGAHASTMPIGTFSDILDDAAAVDMSSVGRKRELKLDTFRDPVHIDGTSGAVWLNVAITRTAGTPGFILRAGSSISITWLGLEP